MDCTRTRELLDAYADGALDSALETEVRAHVAACPAGCPAELRAIEQIGEEMRSAIARRVDAADFSRLWAKVEAGIRAEKAASFGERLRTWWSELLTYRGPVLAAAAAAMLALAVAFPVWRMLGRTGVGDGATGGGLTAGSLVDIESLESSGTVTVWPVTAPDGAETTIIWISADDSGDTPPPEGMVPDAPGGGDESRPAPRSTQGIPG